MSTPTPAAVRPSSPGWTRRGRTSTRRPCPTTRSGQRPTTQRPTSVTPGRRGPPRGGAGHVGHFLGAERPHRRPGDRRRHGGVGRRPGRDGTHRRPAVASGRRAATRVPRPPGRLKDGRGVAGPPRASRPTVSSPDGRSYPSSRRRFSFPAPLPRVLAPGHTLPCRPGTCGDPRQKGEGHRDRASVPHQLPKMPGAPPAPVTLGAQRCSALKTG